jgi:hypothetical protein
MRACCSAIVLVFDFASSIKSVQEPECGPETAMFSGRAVYVIAPLQLDGKVPFKVVVCAFVQNGCLIVCTEIAMYKVLCGVR